MIARYRIPILIGAAFLVSTVLYVLTDRTGEMARVVNQITGQMKQLANVTQQHETLITERVIDLPEDGQVWSGVFVWPEGRESDPASRRLAALFAGEPRLQSLLAQTKVTHYTPSDPLFRQRFAGRLGNSTPQFWLIAPGSNPAQGTAVYAVTGSSLPATGKQMADNIATAIATHCPRPRPTPPGPTPPTPPAPPATPPNIEPGPDPIDESLPVWVWILPVLAAGAGVLQEWRRNS